MSKAILPAALLMAGITSLGLAAPPSSTVTIEDFDCGEGLHCAIVQGWSQGNHALDCTVIMPFESDPNNMPYPVIAWANGWDQGNVVGQCTTSGYLPGLIAWAQNGQFIVIAANQWSVQESDVLSCLQWVVDNEPAAAAHKLRLAGHSQGGGAIIKAGDGEPNGLTISATVAMNPYGPAWVRPGQQDGPILLLGGTNDTTTPVSSFLTVWEAVQEHQGGILAVLEGGTHNSEAWGVAADGETLDCVGASSHDFGEYQYVTELWWQLHLNGDVQSGDELKAILDNPPWDTDYAFSDDFQL